MHQFLCKLVQVVQKIWLVGEYMLPTWLHRLLPYHVTHRHNLISDQWWCHDEYVVACLQYLQVATSNEKPLILHDSVTTQVSEGNDDYSYGFSSNFLLKVLSKFCRLHVLAELYVHRLEWIYNTSSVKCQIIGNTWFSGFRKAHKWAFDKNSINSATV